MVDRYFVENHKQIQSQMFEVIVNVFEQSSPIDFHLIFLQIHFLHISVQVLLEMVLIVKQNVIRQLIESD